MGKKKQRRGLILVSQREQAIKEAANEFLQLCKKGERHLLAAKCLTGAEFWLMRAVFDVDPDLQSAVLSLHAAVREIARRQSAIAERDIGFSFADQLPPADATPFIEEAERLLLEGDGEGDFLEK